jgi:hypothetical protein
MPDFQSPNAVTSTEQEVTLVPTVKIDPRIKDEVLSQVEEQGMVIVHCSYKSPIDSGIRIWATTVLIDKASGDRSTMHHAENITVAPTWTLISAGKIFRFTLIFAPLSKSCDFFDLLEDIPEAGGFFVQNIKRNKSDVYNVVIL